MHFPILSLFEVDNQHVDILKANFKEIFLVVVWCCLKSHKVVRLMREGWYIVMWITSYFALFMICFLCLRSSYHVQQSWIPQRGQRLSGDVLADRGGGVLRRCSANDD